MDIKNNQLKQWNDFVEQSKAFAKQNLLPKGPYISYEQ